MKEKIFFLRGYQKSGTNWLNNVLNLHPKILCRGEFAFSRIYDFLNKTYMVSPFRKKFHAIATEKYQDLIVACVTDQVKKENVEWFGARTPGSIEPILIKGAPIFYISRDGRDILVSTIYHQLRHAALSEKNLAKPEFKRIYNNNPFLYDKLDLFKQDSNYFEKHPEELLTNKEYVQHNAGLWKRHIEKNINIYEQSKQGEIDAKIHFVKYEDMHQDLEGERKKLYEFLGLDPKEAGVLDKLTSPGVKEVNNMKHNRKGIVGDWRNYFTDQVYDWYMEAAGDTIESLYPTRE